MLLNCLSLCCACFAESIQDGDTHSPRLRRYWLLRALSWVPLPHPLWGRLERQPVSTDWLMQGYQSPRYLPQGDTTLKDTNSTAFHGIVQDLCVIALKFNFYPVFFTHWLVLILGRLPPKSQNLNVFQVTKS